LESPKPACFSATFAGRFSQPGLRQAVRGSVREGFEVLRAGAVVATGTVGDEVVELAPGRYEVRTSSGADLGAVTVAAGEVVEVRLRE